MPVNTVGDGDPFPVAVGKGSSEECERSKTSADDGDIDRRLLQLARQMETLRTLYVDPANERLSRIESDLGTGMRSLSVQLTQIAEAISKIKSSSGSDDVEKS